MSLVDGKVTSWFTAPSGEHAELIRLKDGSLLLSIRDTPETYVLYHLLGPDRAVRIGSIPAKVSSLSISEDLKRAAIVVREYRGDASMSRVVRP